MSHLCTLIGLSTTRRRLWLQGFPIGQTDELNQSEEGKLGVILSGVALDTATGKGCDCSVEQGRRGFVYPECLDGGQDFLLVACEGHAHSEQVFRVEL